MLRAPLSSPYAAEPADNLSFTKTVELLGALDDAALGTTCPDELRRRHLAALASVLELPLVVEIAEGDAPLAQIAATRRGSPVIAAYVDRLGRDGVPGHLEGPPSNRTSMIAALSPFSASLREAELRDPVCVSHPSSGTLLLLHRASDRPALGPSESNLVRLFLGERARRMKAIALPPGARTSELTPRLRATLEWLLRGAAEKEIAVHLGLSVHTVHQYVKSLYRLHGVSSRPQLMARCLRT